MAVAELFGRVVVVGGDATRIALLGSGLRWLGVVLLSLFCIGSVQREMDDKVGILWLALPVRREVIYLGKLAGFALLALAYSILAAVDGGYPCTFAGSVVLVSVTFP